MLPKELRLPKSLIPNLFQSGLRTSRAPIVAIYSFTTNPSSRFCIIITKKGKCSAVDRNRTKRLIRESVRKQVKLLSSSIDAILLVTAIKKSTTQITVDAQVALLFSKIRNNYS